jgi:hypothetical protein
MANGKKIFVKVMVHITIQMVIVTKETGIMTFKVVLEHIIIQMVISIKENGSMVNQMVKEITYIMEIKAYIKEIGKTVKNKDLAN